MRSDSTPPVLLLQHPLDHSLAIRRPLGPADLRLTVTMSARRVRDSTLEFVVQVPCLVCECLTGRLGSQRIVSRAARVQARRDSNHHIVLVHYLRLPFWF